MSETVEAVIGFVDRKEDGCFPVLDANGGTIALIKVPWSGDKFTAATTAGQLLCTGRVPAFSRRLAVSDPSGAPLLSLRSSFWDGKKRTITLSDGSELTLQGASWPSRDWAVHDPAGRTVLGIATTAGGWSFHPDAYVVKVTDPRLSLAHVIGIVQANRMLVKRARSSS